LVKAKPESEKKKTTERVIERRNGAAWGGGVIYEGNSVKRTKRNVMGTSCTSCSG
jgi:hypothetical protein